MHQCLLPTTGPHEEHAEEGILVLMLIELYPEATPVSDLLEMRKVNVGVMVKMQFALGSRRSPDLGVISNLPCC